MGKNIRKRQLELLYSEYEENHPGEDLVFGDGNPESGIVMVGEAPGRDEVRDGKPFVGTAGGRLSEFMAFLEIDRNRVYITNSIKHRLYKLNTKTGRKANRPAKVVEIRTERVYLLRELELLEPSLVITLGNVPLKSVTGDFGLNIGEVHGKAFMKDGMRIFPLYHPASLIYNRKLEDVYYADLEALKKILKEGKQ